MIKAPKAEFTKVNERFGNAGHDGKDQFCKSIKKKAGPYSPAFKYTF